MTNTKQCAIKMVFRCSVLSTCLLIVLFNTTISLLLLKLQARLLTAVSHHSSCHQPGTLQLTVAFIAYSNVIVTHLRQELLPPTRPPHCSSLFSCCLAMLNLTLVHPPTLSNAPASRPSRVASWCSASHALAGSTPNASNFLPPLPLPPSLSALSV